MAEYNLLLLSRTACPPKQSLFYVHLGNNRQKRQLQLFHELASIPDVSKMSKIALQASVRKVSAFEKRNTNSSAIHTRVHSYVNLHTAKCEEDERQRSTANRHVLQSLLYSEFILCAIFCSVTVSGPRIKCPLRGEW